MENQPQIVFSERLTGSIVVTFADGSTFLYSADLLHEMAERAIDITSIPEDYSAS